MKKLYSFITFFLFLNLSADAQDGQFSTNLKKLEDDLRNYKLIQAREFLDYLQLRKLTPKEWLQIRDIIHRYPQIGFDVLMKYDLKSTIKVSKIDNAIKLADKLMSQKKFYQAAYGYQEILKYIVKYKKENSERNTQLYWSLIHSLGRAFYGLKQYDEAYRLYTSIPISYPFYKQVQFELMWNNYQNGKLEYALGSIANMTSGNFSKILEPEVYLVQYYINKRMCRNQEAELIKKRVIGTQKVIDGVEVSLGSWIKKDIDTLVYRQILLSGDLKNEETVNLKETLEKLKLRDFERLQKEFALVVAHLELDSGNNKNLTNYKNDKKIEEIIQSSGDKWRADEEEKWIDEVGNYVSIQKDLCE